MTTMAAQFPEFKDRAVLVTGGGSGIGAAIVEGFARQGAKVSFIDIAEAAGRELAERLSRETAHPVSFYHAGIDQDLRNAAVAEFQHRCRPDLGFGDDGAIGLPVIEEAADGGFQIERHILMDRFLAEALGGELGRRDGAGRQDDMARRRFWPAAGTKRVSSIALSARERSVVPSARVLSI